MGDKIDKQVKERVKKFEKKYQEIRKKHSNISKVMNLGIALSSYLISELKAEADSPSLKEISKEIPLDIMKKHSMDKNADVLIKKAENDPNFGKPLLVFLQDWYKPENPQSQQELQYFFEENKGVGKEIAESMEIVRGQYPTFFELIVLIASEFGYVSKPEIVSSPQKPVEVKPAPELKPSVAVTKPADAKKLVEVKKSPEAKPTVIVNKSVEVKKPVEVKPTPEIKPKEDVKKVTELKLDDFSMNMLYPLKTFLNLFNPKFCLDYSQKKIEDIDSYLEVLELPKENKIILRNNLTGFLKLIKTVIDEIKKYPNFMIFLVNAQHIGTLLEIKRIPDMLNYTLTAEDKAPISDIITKYGFTNVHPTDCFKFWEKSTYEEREQIAKNVLQNELIRKNLILVVLKINTLHPVLKILDYWNTLKNYIEIPSFITWIQKVSVH